MAPVVVKRSSPPARRESWPTRGLAANDVACEVRLERIEVWREAIDLEETADRPSDEINTVGQAWRQYHELHG